jgi:hypothetical protein
VYPISPALSSSDSYKAFLEGLYYRPEAHPRKTCLHSIKSRTRSLCGHSSLMLVRTHSIPIQPKVPKILTFPSSRTGTWTRTHRVLCPTQHMALVLLRNPYPLRFYLCHPFLLPARNKRRLYPVAARGTPTKVNGRQHSTFTVGEPIGE